MKIFRIITLVGLVLFLAGCSSGLTTDVRVGDSGQIIIDEKTDQPTIQKLENISSRASLAYQGFFKKDYGFVVFYSLRLSVSDLSGVNAGNERLELRFTMPGEITDSNADEVVDNVLKWTSFNEDTAYAKSKYIRWWLIATVIFGLILAILSRVLKPVKK